MVWPIGCESMDDRLLAMIRFKPWAWWRGRAGGTVFTLFLLVSPGCVDSNFSNGRCGPPQFEEAREITAARLQESGGTAKYSFNESYKQNRAKQFRSRTNEQTGKAAHSLYGVVRTADQQQAEDDETVSTDGSLVDNEGDLMRHGAVFTEYEALPGE